MPCSKNALAALAAVLALALAACDVARPIAETESAASGCVSCHGDGNRPEADPLVQAAPPVTPRGGDPGAHLAHLRGGTFRAALACAECHTVPANAGHMDGVVQLPFPTLARADGAAPAWNATAGTCSGVYCHGATLGGGPAATPSWFSAPSLGCASCHGYPPPSHASTSTSCGACHPGTVAANGALLLANGMHVNGRVDVNAVHGPGWSDPANHGSAAKRDLASCRACHGSDYAGGTTGVSCNACHGGTAWQTSCTFCHGDAARASNPAAPPVGSQGETATTTRAVGAHAKHLAGGEIGPAVACADCHAVPNGLAHVDGTAAVTFGGAAARGGAQPTWNGNACSNTYCHGATLAAGGTKTAPVWTAGAGEAACGTCHGAPPPPPHSTSTTCGGCHTGYTDRTVNAATHINGTLEASGGHPAGWSDPANHGSAAKRDLASCRTCHGTDYAGGTSGVSCNSCHGGTAWQTNCTFCHGDPARPSNPAAPPVGSQGETATTTRAVGAHARHLSGGAIGPAVACAECHSVPTSLSHVDANAAVTFGAAARRGGAAPTWSGTTCSNTYCHGATLAAGGTKTAPLWTGGAGETACGSCHGAPPPAPHTSSTSCSGCHTGYTQDTVNAATHINGTLEASGGHPAGWVNKDQHGYEVNRTGLASCKGCHGTNLDGVGGTAQSCGACHQSAGITTWQTNCTFCHGDRTTGRASPPVDTQGRSVATNVSVGVHASHVGTTITTPLACAECHPSRTGSNVVTDGAHVDGNGVAEIAFGTLARTGGAAATYTRASATSATCASTYCHGRFPGGASSGAGATVSWTSTAQVSCTSCHGNAPATGDHGVHSSYACSECHGHSGSGATHVNGVKNVPFSSAAPGAVYSTSSRSCGSFSCHGESHASSRTW